MMMKLQKEKSRSTMKGSGKDLLFAEHLTEHVLQFCLFIERECSYLLFSRLSQTGHRPVCVPYVLQPTILS